MPDPTGSLANDAPPSGPSPILPWIALGLVLGALVPDPGRYHPGWLWWAGGLPMAVLAVLPRLGRLPLARRWLLFAAAAAAGLWMAPPARPDHEPPALMSVRGTVTSLQAGHWDLRLWLDIDTHLLGPDDDDRLKMIAPPCPGLRPGDRIEVAGLRQSESWNGRQVRVLKATRLERLTPREDGPRGWAWRSLDALDDHRDLAGTLLLGIGRAPEAQDFRRSGLMHVLAVSGMHLAIALAGVALLLKAFAVPWLIRQGLLLVMAFGYLWLTGCNLATQRSAAMVAALILAGLCQRRPHPLAAVSLAALALVALWPGTAREVGFQLSLVAVLGITTLGRDLVHLRRRLAPLQPLPLDGWPWRILLWSTRGLIDGLAVGFAASLAVQPLIAQYLGMTNPWGAVATLLVTPFVTVALCVGVVLMPGAGLLPGLPWSGLYNVLAWSIDALAALAAWCARWPLATVEAQPLPWPMLLLWPLLFIRMKDGWDLWPRLAVAVLATVLAAR